MNIKVIYVLIIKLWNWLYAIDIIIKVIGH